MNALNQQFDNPSPPATVVAESTPTILSTIEDEINVNTIKDQLRACWHQGAEWRLEFGRLLVKLRDVAKHGEWINFLKSEFGLDRQTAHNWMTKAKEADGIPLDETPSRDDEPDTYREELAGAIEEETAKVEQAKQQVKLNGVKRIKLALEGVSEDEYELYKAQMKTDHTWVQSILRAAFDQIIAGKPVVTGQKLDTLPEQDDFFPGDVVVYSADELVAIIGEQTVEHHATA